MTRGNQRDMARAKAAKKAGDSSKGKPKDGLSVAQRKERDSAAIREKQQKKEADAAAAANGAGGTSR